MAYAKKLEKTEYIKALEIATNPKHVVPIGKYETIERINKLEKKIKKHEKIDEISNKIVCVAIPSFLIAAGTACVSLFASLNLTLTAVSGIATLSIVPVGVATILADLVNLSYMEKTKLKLKKLQDVLNPKKRFKEILEKEQKRLEQYERHSKDVFYRSDFDGHIYMASGVGYYVSMRDLDKMTELAKKHLSDQRKIVSVLDTAQGFIEKCDDEEKISKLVELAEDPAKENLVSMQKIISNTPQTEKKPETNRVLSAASLAESKENVHED